MIKQHDAKSKVISESRKTWKTPALIVSEAVETKKIRNPGEIVYSSIPFGNS